MSLKALLDRWGRLDLVIGGVIWAGFHIWYIQAGSIERADQIIPVIWILGVANIFLLAGLFALYGAAVNTGTKAGLAATMLGMVLFALGAVLTSTGLRSAWLLAILGEMITTIGLLIFGSANLSEKLIRIFYWLPLLMALAYFFSWSIDPGSVSMPLENWTEWLAALYGLGWATFGFGFYRQDLIEQTN